MLLRRSVGEAPRSRSPQGPRLGVLCAAIISTASAAARASLLHPAVLATDPPPEVLRVPLSWGEESLLVVRPGDATAQARRSADVGSARAGVNLSSRVVIQVHPILRGAAEFALSAKLRPLAGSDLPGYFVAQAGSVRAAAALAARARALPGVRGAYVEASATRRQRSLPSDSLFPQQWHLRNLVTPEASINAEPAWDAGFTGQGVTIGIVDFGASINHPDLAPNYFAGASQALPLTQRDEHSTACAGLASARAFNTIGGAGLAYNATWANLTYGAGPVDEAAALAFRNDLNSVKSCSWGPDDNGRISYLDPAVRAALAAGASSGRAGLGTVFVWAAGNGGVVDRVDYDPYASSRFVCAIGAVGDLNQVTSYSEPGSCLLGVAPSDGNVRFITTTSYLGSNTYTSSFGGTSASAPTAAGLVALVLQANPSLTWRDVQHVLVASARQVQPSDPDWTLNGAQRPYHERLGFGLLDAGRAVTIAQGFAGVGGEVSASSGVVDVNAVVPDADLAGLSRSASITSNLSVEHVEVTLSVSAPFVGQLRVVVTSPSGTHVTLAEPRFDSAPGYSDYHFTLTRCWGEPAAGVWTITISDEAAGTLAAWNSFRVEVFGHRRCPADVTAVGGAGAQPTPPPDDQLTADDLIVFVNAYIDGAGRADIARVGGVPGPDAQVSVDDLILFVNSFSDGCAW